MKIEELLQLKKYLFPLTLLHSEQPKLYEVFAILSAIGLNHFYIPVTLILASIVIHRHSKRKESQ